MIHMKLHTEKDKDR